MGQKTITILAIMAFILGWGFAAPGAPDEPQAANPVVQGMMEQVVKGELKGQLEELTGERGTIIGGEVYTITTRYTWNTAAINKTTQYAYEQLSGLGLKVEYAPYFIFPYKRWERNVIAEQTALADPTRPVPLVLVTAHIDSTSNAGSSPDPAPGADDNASGSVAVMTAARILSQYDFGCTIRYALFTGEEQGLFGAAGYAQQLKDAGEAVEGVLNLDMLGYSTPGSAPVMELHTQPSNESQLAIAHAFTTTVSDYGLDLIPRVLQDNKRFSDHAAFWDRGYPAILAIEDDNDFTPYYHKTTDRVAKLNLDYYTEFVKAAVGTMAKLGCLLDGQAQGVVSASGLPLPNVTVEAWQGGSLVRSVKTGADGSYVLPLLPGAYDVVFKAEGRHSATAFGVNIVKKQAVIINQDLAPCATLSGLSFMRTPDSTPTPGQSIQFSAFSAGDPPMQYSWDFGDGSSAEGAVVSHVFTSMGGYTVTLRGDNLCAYPQTFTGNLIVGQFVLYMPLIGK